MFLPDYLSSVSIISLFFTMLWICTFPKYYAQSLTLKYRGETKVETLFMTIVPWLFLIGSVNAIGIIVENLK